MEPVAILLSLLFGNGHIGCPSQDAKPAEL